MSEEPVRDCPVCGESTVRRVINQVGIVFKGSGFYVTDNRSKSGHRKGTTNGKADTDSSADSSAPTENKSDKKESKESVASAPAGSAD
jgi:predicted nucleic acid-binding Zn ribbon protein